MLRPFSLVVFGVGFGCARRAGFETCGLRVVLEMVLVVRPAVLCGCYGAGVSLGCVLGRRFGVRWSCFG